MCNQYVMDFNTKNRGCVGCLVGNMRWARVGECVVGVSKNVDTVGYCVNSIINDVWVCGLARSLGVETK